MHLGVKTIRPVWSICHHLPSASERIGFLSLDKTRQLEQMHAWEVHALLCSIDIWCQYKGILWISEGDTLGVTAFCNHWHCTCAMVLSLLCNHWQFLLGFSAMAKQNQNPKTQKNKRQTKKYKMTRPNSLPLLPPWGVQSCISFYFFCFLVFWFLVFWFFEGLRT